MGNIKLALKITATCTILTLLLGYGVSFLQIFNRTTFTTQQVVEYYRGAENTDETGMHLPQSFASLLSVAHVHTFSQPMMLGILAFIFSFCPWSEKKKAFFIILAFVGSVLSNLVPWLVRYISSGYVCLFPVSQTFIFVGLMTMGLASLFYLWKKNS